MITAGPDLLRGHAPADVLRAAYLGAGAMAAALGVYLLAVAPAPLPWPLLALVGVAALAAFATTLTSRLRESRARVPGQRRSALEMLGWSGGRRAVPGVALALLGWCVAAVAMAFAASSGGVASEDGSGACRYNLNDHGATTCVTRTEYEHAAAQQQAILFGGAAFFLGAGATATTAAPSRRSVTPA